MKTAGTIHRNQWREDPPRDVPAWIHTELMAPQRIKTVTWRGGEVRLPEKYARYLKLKKRDYNHFKFDVMPTEIEGIKFYRIPEVAEALGVTTETVRAWLKKGRLKGVRVGRPILITEKNLRDFLTGETTPTSVNIT